MKIILDHYQEMSWPIERKYGELVRITDGEVEVLYESESERDYVFRRILELEAEGAKYVYVPMLSVEYYMIPFKEREYIRGILRDYPEMTINEIRQEYLYPPPKALPDKPIIDIEQFTEAWKGYLLK